MIVIKNGSWRRRKKETNQLHWKDKILKWPENRQNYFSLHQRKNQNENVFHMALPQNHSRILDAVVFPRLSKGIVTEKTVKRRYTQ